MDSTRGGHFEDSSRRFLRASEQETERMKPVVDEMKALSEKVERLKTSSGTRRKLSDCLLLSGVVLSCLSLWIRYSWADTASTVAGACFVSAFGLSFLDSPKAAEEELCSRMSRLAAEFHRSAAALEPELLHVYGSCVHGSGARIRLGARVLLLLSALNGLQRHIGPGQVPEVTHRFSSATQGLQQLRTTLTGILEAPPAGGKADCILEAPPAGGKADCILEAPPAGGKADCILEAPPVGGKADCILED